MRSGQKQAIGKCAVLVDLDTSNLIAILGDRTQKLIGETLTQWGIEVLEQI
ncbi:MAG: hypothetical protein RMY36_026555 [Nostoc sp. SerVER01]|nr:hypothetical protein [Nostoc sp. SerVER01]MDZ8081329.1 hypothetical protein [Nostoc sp. DcaGUA01]